MIILPVLLVFSILVLVSVYLGWQEYQQSHRVKKRLRQLSKHTQQRADSRLFHWQKKLSPLAHLLKNISTRIDALFAHNRKKLLLSLLSLFGVTWYLSASLKYLQSLTAISHCSCDCVF